MTESTQVFVAMLVVAFAMGLLISTLFYEAKSRRELKERDEAREERRKYEKAFQDRPIQRWDILLDGSCIYCIEPEPDGAYVLYTDHCRALKEIPAPQVSVPPPLEPEVCRCRCGHSSEKHAIDKTQPLSNQLLGTVCYAYPCMCTTFKKAIT